MKSTRTIVIISLITLLSAICSGESYAEEDIVQDFQTMVQDKDLVFSEDYHIGVTDFVTYTCNSYVSFAPDHMHTGVSVASAVISLVFNQYSMMTTTAVENLNGLQIIHLPDNAMRTNLHISLSTDSLTWSLLEGDDILYENGSITATFPKGTYYIRMTNEAKNKTVSVSRIRYKVHNCNCFPYQESE